MCFRSGIFRQTLQGRCRTFEYAIRVSAWVLRYRAHAPHLTRPTQQREPAIEVTPQCIGLMRTARAWWKNHHRKKRPAIGGRLPDELGPDRSRLDTVPEHDIDPTAQQVGQHVVAAILLARVETSRKVAVMRSETVVVVKKRCEESDPRAVEAAVSPRES